MSHEIEIAEAVASLTARLNTWAVEDAATKAHEYVTDMLRNGWRPRAPKAWTEEPGIAAHNRVADPTPYVQQARELLHGAKAINETEETP